MSNPINFKWVQLASQNAPSIIVDKRSEIVLYGVDNKYPQFLLDLSIQSSLHTAILDKKIKMGIADGFTYDGASDKKTDFFLENPNPYETMNDILEKTYNDLEIFGGFALSVLWAKDKKNIAQIYHTPFQNIRSGKVNDKNQVTDYYYFDEWSKYTRITDAQRYPAFSPFADKGQPQIFYCKKYSPTNLYYPIPGYVGGINDINTLQEISNFHNACITNNFQPGIMIIFRGPRPSEEEQDVIMKALTEKYKGSQNAGTPSVFFLDTEQQAPQIEQTAISDLDKQYSTLTEAVKESVVMAHSIPRIVAGLETPGSLGGGKEIVEANQIFYNNYVVNNQSFLLRYFNKITEINKLKELEIKNTNNSLLLYSEAMLTTILSRDEQRELFGYEALDTNVNKGRLVEVLGVGGTQALQAILSDINMTVETKRGLLKIVFGLTEEDINELIPITTVEEPKNNIIPNE